MSLRIALLLTLLGWGCSDKSAPLVPDAEPPPPPIDAMVPPDAPPPFYLSETGLYSDIENKLISEDAAEFAPAHVLWTDAAVKRRWLLLPEGQTIDSSDMDHWVFPVGTKVFKEFVRDDVLVETRMIWRRGASDYFLGAFVWNEDKSNAVFVAEGEDNAGGTDHDVPSALQCVECHIGEPGQVLGFSAVQLSKDDGLNLDQVIINGWLSDNPPPDTSYPMIGRTTEEIAAFGYLHANCGHCHAQGGSAFADLPTLTLRLEVAESTAGDALAAKLYSTTVDQDLVRWILPPYYKRIVAGDPDTSGIVGRMNTRGPEAAQMPPLGTEDIDTAGVAILDDWVTQLGE